MEFIANCRMNNKIRIFDTEDDLAEKFCTEFFKTADDYIARGVYFNVALSGGSTPLIIYRKIADDHVYRIDWRGVRFFWGDERCVPPDDPQSNYGKAKEYLLDKIPVPAENIFRIYGENDPAVEAGRYSDEFMSAGLKQFDFTMLGLGEDGHTASIFPNDLALFDSPQLFTATKHPDTKQNRITATGSLINKSTRIVILAAGERKAKIVERIINRPGDYMQYPAANLNSGSSEWFIDSRAANLLNQ